MAKNNEGRGAPAAQSDAISSKRFIGGYARYAADVVGGIRRYLGQDLESLMDDKTRVATLEYEWDAALRNHPTKAIQRRLAVARIALWLPREDDVQVPRALLTRINIEADLGNSRRRSTVFELRNHNNPATESVDVEIREEDITKKPVQGAGYVRDRDIEAYRTTYSAYTTDTIGSFFMRTVQHLEWVGGQNFPYGDSRVLKR